jgi:hypothetical protein
MAHCEKAGDAMSITTARSNKITTVLFIECKSTAKLVNQVSKIQEIRNTGIRESGKYKG